MKIKITVKHQAILWTNVGVEHIMNHLNYNKNLGKLNNRTRKTDSPFASIMVSVDGLKNQHV